jgi:hypothetical protein
MIDEYFHIVTDPAHGLAEITYSLVIDLLVFGLIWGTFWTKWLKPRLKREVHSEIDMSHGYVHNEGGSREEDFDRPGRYTGVGSANVRVFRTYTATPAYEDSDSRASTGASV